MKQNHTPSSRRTVGTSRLAVGVSAVAAGLALLLTPLGASGQTTDDVTAQTLGNVITVTQTPSGVGGDCVPASLAILNGTVTVQPFSDATKFQLNVHSAAPLCEPLTAKAVVYTMPSNGDTFPQQLNETKDISIQEAGDTLIVFAKECDRVQYDLVTGAPPAVLNTGFDHQPCSRPPRDGLPARRQRTRLRGCEHHGCPDHDRRPDDDRRGPRHHDDRRPDDDPPPGALLRPRCPPRPTTTPASPSRARPPRARSPSWVAVSCSSVCRSCWPHVAATPDPIRILRTEVHAPACTSFALR